MNSWFQSSESVLSFVQAIDELLLGEPSNHEVLGEICRLLVLHKDYSQVWVGLAAPDSAHINPVAMAGSACDPAPADLNSCSEVLVGRSLCETAIKERKPVLSRNITNKTGLTGAKGRGKPSDPVMGAAFPLIVGDHFYGAITLATLRESAFDEIERKLIRALTGKVSQALHLLTLAHRESEERFSQLAEITGELIWEVDPQGRYIYVNKVCTSLLGYARDDMLGKMHFSDLCPVGACGEGRQQLFSVFSGQQRFVDIPNKIQAKDGRILEVLTSGLPVVDTHGQFIGYRGVERDVTAWRQAENALQSSRENFRQLAEEINDAIFEINNDGLITYASPVFESLLGYECSDLTGRPYSDFIYAEDLPRVQVERQETLNNRLHSSEFRLHAKDGSVHWVRTSSRPIWKNGQIEGVRGVLSLMDENKKAQEALWASEERFRTLVEKTADCFLLIDQSGLVNYVSPPIFKMIGRNPEDLIGHHFTEHVHPDSQAAAHDALGQVLAHPQDTATFAARVMHVDGTWRTLEGVVTNLLMHDAVRGILINCQDVTKRDSLERQLRQAQKMEAIGTLAGGIAHDFNNMLFAIMGLTTMGMKRARKNKLLYEDLSQILSASRRSADLVRQLLIFSRQGEKANVEIAVTPILKETCGCFGLPCLPPLISKSNYWPVMM